MKYETCQLWLGITGTQCGEPIEEEYNGFDADMCPAHRAEHAKQFEKEG